MHNNIQVKEIETTFKFAFEIFSPICPRRSHNSTIRCNLYTDHR